MSKKMLFKISAALAFSIGLSMSASAQESTPTPAPTPMQSPSPMPSPIESPMPTPVESPSPAPTPMMPSPTPSPVVQVVPVAVPVVVEEPKKAEAVTVTKTGSQDKKATTETVASTYDVPLLNVPSFNNKTTEIKVKFAGELEGLKGKAYITPNKDGVTQIKMRFDDMKMAPKQKRFVLWAVAPDKSYTKIGQVINSGDKQEAEIRGETALADFGLFVTQEEADVTTPSGNVYSPLGVGGL